MPSEAERTFCAQKLNVKLFPARLTGCRVITVIRASLMSIPFSRLDVYTPTRNHIDTPPPVIYHDLWRLLSASQLWAHTYVEH
jgi:hypothetical protein